MGNGITVVYISFAANFYSNPHDFSGKLVPYPYKKMTLQRQIADAGRHIPTGFEQRQ